MSGALVMVKTALLKQVRSYRFLVVVAISVAVAWLCVPTTAENYNIFIIGSRMRGLYNSAYLGAIAVVASSIVLFIAGFYLLRSQISEDRDLRIGQIIAARPIGKLWYVGSKALSNLIVLLFWEAVCLVTLMVVQLIRGEDMHISLWGYLQPFLEITLPILVVLASLTVLFDTFPFLKGMLGNVVFFALWNVLIIVPAENKGFPVLDLFGFDRISNALSQGAVLAHPELDPKSLENVSFGLNFFSSGKETFRWDGLAPDAAFLESRLVWIGIAVVLVLLAALVFDRFRRDKKLVIALPKRNKPDNAVPERAFAPSLSLSPVTRTSSASLFAIIKGELKIMGSELSWITILLILTGFCLNLFLPLDSIGSWITLFLVLPTSILSGMGCRDYRYRTRAFLICRCDLREKWFAEMISGFMIMIAISGGAILRGVISGLPLQSVSYLVGAFFTVALAGTLGTMTHGKRLFEALYLIWVYMGPFQLVPGMNFVSDSPGLIAVYGVMGAVLTVIGYFVVSLEEKGAAITFRRKSA